MKPRATSVPSTTSFKTFNETFAMPFELHAADRPAPGFVGEGWRKLPRNGARCGFLEVGCQQTELDTLWPIRKMRPKRYRQDLLVRQSSSLFPFCCRCRCLCCCSDARSDSYSHFLC